MAISLRQIHREMDECPSESKASISLIEIARQHRWSTNVLQSSPSPLMPSPFHLQWLVKRHLHPQKKILRFLWYNTYLIHGFNLTQAFPPPLKNILPNIEVGEGPARYERAGEIGLAIKHTPYDVFALCEIFEVVTRNQILAAWPVPKPIYVEGPPGRTLELGYGFLKQMVGELGGVPAQFFQALDSMVKTAQDIANTLTFGLVGKAEKATLPTVYIAGSGLITFTTHQFPFIGKPRWWVFREQGNIFRDADAWSNKGVLLTYLDTGFSAGRGKPVRIQLYSTHLFYGGGLIGDLDDATRRKIQESQFNELIEFIGTHQRPQDILIVAGDFNYSPEGGTFGDLRYRLEAEFGLEDVWTRYAVGRHGAKVGRTNDPACTEGPEVCNQDFCNDYANNNIDEAGRIDYVFVQKPQPQHRIIVDIARPRRRRFHRHPSSKDFDKQSHMSDHLGIDLKLILTPVEHVPATPKPGR